MLLEIGMTKREDSSYYFIVANDLDFNIEEVYTLIKNNFKLIDITTYDKDELNKFITRKIEKVIVEQYYIENSEYIIFVYKGIEGGEEDVNGIN